MEALFILIFVGIPSFYIIRSIVYSILEHIYTRRAKREQIEAEERLKAALLNLTFKVTLIPPEDAPGEN